MKPILTAAAVMTALLCSSPVLAKARAQVEGCLKGMVKTRACDRMIQNYWQHNTSIERVAREERIDPLLLKSLVAYESRYNSKAVSPKRATGLTQVMPATAAELGVSNRIHLYDAEVSLRTGSRYFRQMQDLFPGRLDLALAAYNAGPNRVRRAGGIPKIKETQDYVRNILALYREFQLKESRTGHPGRGNGLQHVTMNNTTQSPTPRVSLPTRRTGPVSAAKTTGKKQTSTSSASTKKNQSRFKTSNESTSSSRFQTASNGS